MTNKYEKNIVVAWLPHEEFRIISQLLSIIEDGIQYISYKRYFNSIESKFKETRNESWYVYTVNAYYDLAIRNWCMVFGSYSEPTHYSQLLRYEGVKSKLEQVLEISELDRDKLRKYFLEDIRVPSNEYSNYHKSIKEYRDRYLTHREHHPNKISDGDLNFPELELAKETFISIYLIMIKIVKLYPKEKSADNERYFRHLCFDNRNEICEQVKRTYPNVGEFRGEKEK